MTAEEFIRIKTVVHDSSVRGMIKTLERPVGRRPQKRLVELSEWFRSLTEEDKTRVRLIIELAVHAGIFNFLSVIDGVQAIEDGPDKGELKLFHTKGGENRLLNDFNEELLHDVYQGQVYDQVFGQKD